MSSNTSLFYDAVKTALAATLTTHNYLSDPYSPEQCSEEQLEKGYGFYFGAGVNTNLQMSCQQSVERIVTLVITRRAVALERNRVGKEDVEKLLLDDLFAVQSRFESDANIKSNNNIASFSYVEDSGIEPVFDDKKTHLKIVANFKIVVFDNLT